MSILIVVPDGSVIVDGVAAKIDLSSYPFLAGAHNAGVTNGDGFIDKVNSSGNYIREVVSSSLFDPIAIAHADIVNTPEPQKSIEEVRLDKLLQAHTYREQQISSGVTYAGHIYDSDPQSIININGAATMALVSKTSGQPLSVEWTLKDNTSVTLNENQLLELGMTVGALKDTHFRIARKVKDQIIALQTVSEINVFNIESNWMP